MSAPSFNQTWLEDVPVIGILRGFNEQEIESIVPAGVRGGLRHLEITMNSDNPCQLIRQSIELSDNRMNIGAGTVLTEQDMDDALGAGASYVVTPVVNETVIKRCVERKIPVFPGAFTPTEIVRAWDLGATMVKVFPANQLGPAYLRNVKAPLPHIKLLPTGGVNLETLPAYAGVADGFGVGSPLFKTERILAKDWDWVERQCRAFCEAVRNLL